MRKIGLILILALGVLLVANMALAPPPSPHNIRGTIYYPSGIGVPDGIPLHVNNTALDISVLTYVLAPNPSKAGAYATAIDGVNGDAIIVRAWNSTHYGQNNTILASQTYVNVVINITRSSETNVSITNFQSNSLYNMSNVTQINATIRIIGGQNGVDCYAFLGITNQTVFNITSAENFTHYLGNIALSSTKKTTWNITAKDEGNTHISVNAYCDSDGINFNGENNDTKNNIILQDITPPSVYLMFPGNASNISFASNPITLTYNVSDDSQILNCSLVVNGKINLTNYTITRNSPQYFYQDFSIGNYTWFISCVDNSSLRKRGNSSLYNLTIVPNNNPIISNMQMEDPINLLTGTTLVVYCNFTVRDDDNISDIRDLNATLYHSTVFANSTDDNNNHYTNNSCTNTSSTKYEINYTCGFPMQYYSNNNTWTCNATAVDNSDSYGSLELDTTVNELIGIEVTPSTLDFGELAVGDTSPEDINLTITNFGNKAINISLKGYALSEGDGLGMDCIKGEIPVNYQKYSTKFNAGFANMVNLTDGLENIANFTLPQRTDDSDYGRDRNKTYWKLQLPYAINGNCNGTIFLMAVPT